MRTKSQSANTTVIERSALPAPRRAPTHPGGLLRRILEEEGVSQEKLAAQLGVTFQTINAIVNEKSGITPLMAARLERRFEGMVAQGWLNMQNAVDLWYARRKLKEEERTAHP